MTNTHRNLLRTRTLITIVATVIAGSLLATPAFADTGSTSAEQDSEFAAKGAPVSSRTSTTDQTLVQRVNELVAAYDQTTKEFDPSNVSTETLNSSEGEAFIAIVSSTTEDPVAASAEVESSFAALRQALIASGGPMTTGTNDDPSATSFSLAPGVTLTYPSATGASPRVTGGADPFPYVQLTGAEQQAMVTGASATLIATICALLGPETAGIGCGVGAAVIGTIVGIIVANGVCANDREMRIYPLAGPTGFSCQ